MRRSRSGNPHATGFVQPSPFCEKKPTTGGDPTDEAGEEVGRHVRHRRQPPQPENNEIGRIPSRSSLAKKPSFY
ncbi:hypothetical protein MRX96_013286 [Rhipicephalus microplus]